MPFSLVQLRDLIRQQIVHRCANQTWNAFGTKLWLSVIDNLDQTLCEKRTARLSFDKHSKEIVDCLTFPLQLPSPNRSTSFVATLLSVAIIFEKYDLFLYLFPHCYRAERKRLQKYYSGNRFSVREVFTLWNIVCKNVPLIPSDEEKLSEVEHDTKLQVFCRLMLLLKNLHQPGFDKSMHHIMSYLQSRSSQPAILYKKCVEHLDVLTKYLGLNRKRKRGGSTKSAPLFLPPVTKYFVEALRHETLPLLFSDPKMQKAFMEKIYQSLCQRFDSELSRWVGTVFHDFHRYLDGPISLYMSSLHYKLLTNHPKAELKLATSGLAFELLRSKCHFSLFDQYCIVSFPVGDHRYQCIVSRSDFDQKFCQTLASQSWIFIRYKTVTGAKTHPWLKQRLEKFGGRVPRLRFMLDRSDGILLPWHALAYWVPDLKKSGVHGADLTTHLNLYSSSRSKRIKFRDISHPHWLHTLPFPTRCFLRPEHLLMLATDYMHFDTHQRLVFHSVFWNLSGMNIRCCVDRPALREFVIRMVDKISDWRALSRKMISELLPFTQSGDLEVAETPPTLFWDRIQSFTRLVTPSAQALGALASRRDFNVFPILASSLGRPQIFPEILKISHKLRLPFLASAEASVMAMMKLLFTRDVPSPLKRLAWQSLVLSHFATQRPHSLEDGHFDATDLPVPRIHIPLLSPEPGSRMIVYDRHKGMIDDIPWLRQYVGSFDTSPEAFDLSVKNEDGRGQSVYLEILQNLWKKMINKQVMMLYDCDSDVSKMGFCISANLADLYPYPHLHRDWLFALGFVSGLCVSRGLYLPYRLYEGLWRYLYYRDQSGISLIPFTTLFQERFESCMAMIGAMSNEDLKQNMGLSEEEVDFKTRDELVISNFMPNTMDLEEFRAGWSVFMHRIPLTSLVGELNGIMCEPERQTVTFESFVQCFEQKAQEDELFLCYVRTCSDEQTLALLSFITGKTRLPLYELGEEKISMVWAGGPGQLPTAQNCTHTLIMPSDANHVDVETLGQVLAPIFKFETVYGFS